MYAPAVAPGGSLLVRALVVALVVALTPPAAPIARAADGQITIAVHISLAPTWFDPAETVGVVTPFLMLYALHDALVNRSHLRIRP